jgi:FkbM family methyltransferase
MHRGIAGAPPPIGAQLSNNEFMAGLQRLQKEASTLFKSLPEIGAPSLLLWFLLRLKRKLSFPWPEHWHAHPRQVVHDLTVRLGGSSDLDVFTQIFVYQEYSCLRGLEDVSLVLDLGANVGYSSAYFLDCFPNSRVLAVEPDDRNVEVCRGNLEPYGNRAILVHGAVWSECTHLNISKGTYGDGREWATQVFQSSDGSAGDVEGWDVSSLIDMAGNANVDLLKVDIERAELAVFGEAAKKWLPGVRNICIELHGPDCAEAFFGALAGFDYGLEYSGELTICKNLRAKTAAALTFSDDSKSQAS